MLNSREGIEFLNNLTIDPIFLRELIRAIEKARKKMIQSYRKAKNSQQRDAADAIAQREICDLLNRIMNRNNGKLPSSPEFLSQAWVSYGCVKAF